MTTDLPTYRLSIATAAGLFALAALASCRPAEPGPRPPKVAVVDIAPRPHAKAAPAPDAPETKTAALAPLVEPVAPEEASLEVGDDIPPPKTCPRLSPPKSPPIDTMDWLGLFDVMVSDFPEAKPPRPADNRRARDSICFRSSGATGVAPELDPKECPLDETVIEATTDHMFFADSLYILWPRGEQVSVYRTMRASWGAGPDRPGQSRYASGQRTKTLLAVLETSVSERWDTKANEPRIDSGEAKLVVTRLAGEKQLVLSPLAPKTTVHLRGTSVVLEPPAGTRMKCPTTFEVP